MTETTGILFDEYKVLIDQRSPLVGGSWQGDPKSWWLQGVFYFVPTTHASDVLRFFYEKTLEYDSPVIIDIGASTGSFCLLGAINKDITCYAFEPNPEVFEILKINLKLNKLDKVKAFQMALADKEVDCILKNPKANDSGLATLGIPTRFKEWTERVVPTFRFDTIVKKEGIDRIDLIKIDTEGCELPILKGAENAIKQFNPDLLVEVNPENTSQFGYEPKAIFELLSSWGYDHFMLEEDNAFFSKRFIKIYIVEGNRRGKPTYRKESPGESCRWKNIVSVEDIKEADYLVIINEPVGFDIPDFPPEHILYFKREPDEFLFVQHYWDKVPLESHVFPLGDLHEMQRWHIQKSYDELKQMDFPEKTKKLSCVMSNYGDGSQPPDIQVLQGHKLRWFFMRNFLQKYPEEVDVYGKRLDAYKFKWNKGWIVDKWDGLRDYRYSFVFENSWQPGLFTEKLCGPVLAGCMPIYWGCPNLEKFFPENSFIRLDISKEDAPDRAMEIVNSDFREQHLDELREAKKRILEEYNVWPTLYKIVNKIDEELKK